MHRVHKGISTRDAFRKEKAPWHPTRHVPALSTQEAAALVLGVTQARRRHGWRLDQIAWHRLCRDTAVVQEVTRQLEHGADITEEV